MVGVTSRGFLRPLQGLLIGGTFGQLTDVELLERFTRRDDPEAAFEALVVRHGPAVLQVCRRILGESHDAEDAFQVTFLVLARRAHSLACPQTVGAWLQGVARRVAQKARVANTRRRLNERRLAEATYSGRMSGHDDAGPLQEELDRLPESLRAPVVLCYLEEMTYDAAARRLGVTEGTIRGRLVKARHLLRARVARRTEIGLARPRCGRADELKSPKEAVPLALITATTRAAMTIANDRIGTIGASAAVIKLMEGVLTMMFVTRLKIAAAVVAALGLVMAGAAVFVTRADDIALQQRSSTGAAGAGAAVTSDDASTQKRMTLQQAIERYLRENAQPLAARLAITAVEARRLAILLRSDQSTGAVADPKHPVRSKGADRQRAPSEDARPRRILEAQYQDALRNQIDAVYKSFVSVESMQERLQRASANQARWDRLLEATRLLVETGAKPASDVDRIRTARDAARSTRDDAVSDLRHAKGALGSLLNLPVKQFQSLEVASRLRQLRSAVLPPVDELVALALAIRPDLAANRLGEKRAEANLAAQRADRLSDAYLLYQPFTFANTHGTGQQDRSWAMGVSLPIYYSNDGNVARAKINLQQSHIQTASMERQVADAVQRAHLDCELSKSELSRTEDGVLAEAVRLRDAAEQDYLGPSSRGVSRGSSKLESLLLRWSAYEKAERRYVEILARYLRSALDLNTAVGERIMP